MSNDISKIGLVSVSYPPSANNITKFGVVAVTRLVAANIITKMGLVIVMRPKVLVDSNRRRQGMLPIF